MLIKIGCRFWKFCPMVTRLSYDEALQSYTKTRTLNIMLSLKLKHLERQIDAEKRRIEIVYKQEESRKQLEREKLKRIIEIFTLFDTRMY